MYEKFKFERIALSLIRLDDRNPRIVTPEKLSTQDEIIEYLFEHEELAAFIKTIVSEGRNPGAERPYVIRDGKAYVVIEGNTRIAAYKLLTGQLMPPDQYKSAVPSLDQSIKDELLSVDVAIAPSRDSLMTIMARAHFGRGEKTRWSYLGSRKAVYEDWRGGKSIGQLANVFGRPQGAIRDLILEYLLYLKVLELDWTPGERESLLRPALEFNPPVRFLQSVGHKKLVGIELDKVNLEIKLLDGDSAAKLKHLIRRTVIDDNGPSATASYAEVFSDYVQSTDGDGAGSSGSDGESGDGGTGDGSGGGGSTGGQGDGAGGGTGSSGGSGSGSSGPKSNALFAYTVSKNDLTLRQLMKEAKDINAKRLPGAASALLRAIIEVILKLIIEEKALNSAGKLLDLEGALNLVIGQGKLSEADRKILKELKTAHLGYLNLSTHATICPNVTRALMVRDCIDQFVKRHV